MSVRRLGILTGLILVVLLSIPYLVLIIIDQSDEQAWITGLVNEAIDREVMLDAAKVKWGLQPEILVEGLQIKHASQSSDQSLFQADRIALKMSLDKLATSGLSVFSLDVAGARLILGQGGDDDRSGSVQSGSTVAADGAARMLRLLDSVSITDSEVVRNSAGRASSLSLHEARLDSRFGGFSDLYLHAAFRGMTLELSGMTGGMTKIASGKPVPLELVGYAGEKANQMTVSGQVDDILNGRGIDLWVQGKIANLNELSLLAGFQLPDYSGLTGKVHVVQAGAFDSMQFKQVEITGAGFGPVLRIDGQIGRVEGWRDIALDYALSGAVGEPGVLVLPGVGGLMEMDVKGSVSGESGALDLIVSQGTIMTRDAVVDISGTIGNIFGDWATPAKLKLRMRPETRIIPDFLRTLPALSAEADLYREAGRLDARNLWIRGGSNEDSDIWLLGEGMLHDIGGEVSGTVSLSSSLDGDVIAKLTDSDQLVDINLIAQARWIVENGMSYLDDIEIDGTAPGIVLSGTGAYPELGNPESVRIEFRVNGDSLGRLGGLLGSEFPDTGEFSGSAELTGSEANLYRLENLVFSVQGEELEAEVTGEVVLNGPDLPLDLDFRSKITDQSLLEQFAGGPEALEEFGFLFPLSAGGTLLGSVDSSGRRRYSLEQLELVSHSKTHDMEATGHIRDFKSSHRQGVIDLSLSGSVNTGREERFLEWSGRFPFLRGNLEARTRLAIHPDRIETEGLDLLIRGDRFQVSAQGTLKTLNPVVVQRMNVRFSADDLSDLYDFSDAGLNDGLPVQGDFTISGEGTGQSMDMNLSLADDQIIGSLRFGLAGNESERRTLSGRIFADSLDLTRILKPPEESNQVFSRTPISLGWLLDHTDIDIDLDFRQFRNRVLHLRHLDGKIQTSAESLEVVATGLSDTQPLDMHVTLDRHQDRWISRVRLQGEEVDMGILPDLLEQQNSDMGTFSVDLDLSGEGNSISEMAATANGQVYLELDDARVKGKVLRLLSADFLLGVFDSIWTKKQEWINTECGAFLLNVKDGKATTDQGLAIKFEDFTLIGGGQLDLSDEQLDIVFSSKARKGLGINTNTLAKMVRVGGTIKNPEIGTDSRGLIKTGLALGAAYVSGGLSLIAQGLLDKQVANSDVCRLVQEQYVRTRDNQIGSG